VSISTRYVLIASMDVTPEAEPLFNEVYDTEHVPNLLQVPGVRSVTRMKGESARFAISLALCASCPRLARFTRRSTRSTIRRSCRAHNGPKPSSADGGRAKCARTLRTGSICYSRSSKPRRASETAKGDVPLVRLHVGLR
jgi:hypothetical protein